MRQTNIGENAERRSEKGQRKDQALDSRMNHNLESIRKKYSRIQATRRVWKPGKGGRKDPGARGSDRA